MPDLDFNSIMKSYSLYAKQELANELDKEPEFSEHEKAQFTHWYYVGMERMAEFVNLHIQDGFIVPDENAIEKRLEEIKNFGGRDS